MENFNITDELLKEIQAEVKPATPEEIAKRPKPADDFELMQGDRDKKITDREKESQR